MDLESRGQPIRKRRGRTGLAFANDAVVWLATGLKRRTANGLPLFASIFLRIVFCGDVWLTQTSAIHDHACDRKWSVKNTPEREGAGGTWGAAVGRASASPR